MDTFEEHYTMNQVHICTCSVIHDVATIPISVLSDITKAFAMAHMFQDRVCYLCVLTLRPTDHTEGFLQRGSLQYL